MTIFRSNAAVLATMLVLAAFGCTRKTMTVPQILASDLQDGELLEAFDRRLDELALDRTRMREEMSKAGFVDTRRRDNCGTWEYPKGKGGIYAFAMYCDVKTNEVELSRVGIRRESMSYD